MPVRMKLEDIGQNITLAFDQMTSPEARRRLLAQFAREKVAEAAAHNSAVLGRPARFETFVDGTRSPNLESVRPDGQIVAEFELVEEVLLWVGDRLFESSPHLTGRYQRSHELFIDGVVYESDGPFPALWDEAFFANTQPYARKIERGLSAQAPDGVYQYWATKAASRFGNIARIKFGYRTPLFGAINYWAARTKMTGKGRPMSSRTRAEWLRRQPAIIITPR
jgi:hypothetical protein